MPFRKMRVHVPAVTSKHFKVPEYEVPLIMQLWGPHTMAGQQIEAQYIGSNVDELDLDNDAAVTEEFERVSLLYRHPEGESVATEVFGSLSGFKRHLREVAVTEAEGPIDLLRAGKALPKSAGGKKAEGKKAEGKEGGDGAGPAPESVAHIPKLSKKALAALTEAGIETVQDFLDTPQEVLTELDGITEKNIAALLQGAEDVANSL